MADGSTIEWLNRPGTKPATWNPIRAYDKATGKRGWFCVHKSDGCRFCYAETQNMRGGDSGGNGHAYVAQNLDKVRIELHEPTLLQPLRWREPRTIFPCSMTDIFGEFVPGWMLDLIFQVMRLTPQHTYLPLTKRAERMRDYLAARTSGDPWAEAADHVADLMGIEDHPIVLEPRDIPLANVWLGVSAERQEEADERIPLLLQTPAAIRFVSAEPLIGRINLRSSETVLRGQLLDWVIAGGESGKNARPMHPDWARSLRDQCEAAGVAFFFKQWGAWCDTHPDWPRATAHAVANDGTAYLASDLAYPDGRRRGEALRNGHDHASLTSMYRIGKKAAGRALDGKEHNGFPDISVTQRGLASPDDSKRRSNAELRAMELDE